ncbi:U3 small nucleolar ribonucleoprotein protein MPP10 [Lutzomyia longipalpis]|uniref:U3 small nucleolar ribonucleoprotein protein MPP10 n=1 Tax=Lutzomyia longipalpis TaxID=7200 RepID=UPI0024841407|nr:U3 small nucleolar ribonucleoprotein protein MPP10 [Lutzomyia longipalpis]
MELKSLENSLKNIDKITKSKQSFIKAKQQDYDKLVEAAKDLTDFAIGQEKSGLISLVVDNLDQEQIFQQIEINNEAVLPEFVEVCGRLLRKSLAYNEEEEEELENGQDEEEDIEGKEEQDGEEAEDEESELDEEEAEGEGSEQDEEKAFLENSKSFLNDEEDSGSEDDDAEEGEESQEKTDRENGPKSTFEEVSDKLKEKISEMEEEALQGRSWQMKGEITGAKREKNALLEEVLEFDLGARPQPQITEKTSKSLEGIILQRIQSKCYDNVVRKVRVDTEQRFSKELVLDHTKSSVPLSELYEKSYMKQISGDKNAEEEDKQAPQKKEITKMLNTLFGKLDALSNFYHTLNRDGKELKIISSDPVTAEDCLVPESANDAQLMAPPEDTVEGKKKKKRKIFNKPDAPVGKFKRLKEEKVKKRKITDLIPLEDALKTTKKKKVK